MRRGGLEELPAAVLAHLDTALRSGLGGVFLLVALMAGAAFLAGLRFPKGVSTAPAGPPNAVEVSALSTGETGPMES